jgi:polysaccharide export outer membrane protein
MALAILFVVAFTLAGQARAAECDYTLGTGDRVRVTVFGNEDLSGVFDVGGSGMISYPLVGPVRASGLSLRQLEHELIGKLKPDYLKDPRVSAEVLNYRPFYIWGEVRRPGSYAYICGMRVVNAIAVAGGYTYRADDDDLRITRAGDPAGTQQQASHDTLVMPGDVIEVPERFF